MLRCRARADSARLSPCAPAAHRCRPVRARAGPRDSGRPRRRRQPGPLLELVEGSRVPRCSFPAPSSSTGRIPVSVLNFAWHRLEWPPVEWLAGPVDVAHAAHPLMLPARRALEVVTIHDLDFLDHPDRTAAEIRRDYPALDREPCPSSGPGGGGLGAHRARGHGAAGGSGRPPRLVPAGRSARSLPSVQGGARADRVHRHPRTSQEPAQAVRGLRAGRQPDAVGAAAGARRPPCRTVRGHPRTSGQHAGDCFAGRLPWIHHGSRAPTALRRGVDAGAAVAGGRLRDDRRRGDAVGSAGRCGGPRGAARSGRRCRRRHRPDSCG